MNMVNIDEIMKLIDWNQTDENQQKGIEMAKDVKCINAFILPLHANTNKNVWDNCAIILSKRTDEELRPYLSNLMEWLEDLNWPGSLTILERLNNYSDKKWLKNNFNYCYNIAKSTNNTNWLYGLKQLDIAN